MNLNFANKVTVFRILAVPFFIGTIVYYTPEREYLKDIALGIFIVAVISDLIDGYIARTRKEKTKAGALLDPLADKLLLISAFISLYKMGSILGPVTFPLWVVLAVISLDIILLLGSMIIYTTQGHIAIEPTRWGKSTTFFQILSIFGVLLQIPFSPVIWYVTVLLTVISGVGYIRRGIKILNAGT